MAQVLRADAFPGRRGGDVPYSLETAYGYRLDLGFLGYVEAIEKGLTLRRVPVGRRPHRASWAASAETLVPPTPPDPRVERTLRGVRRRLEEEGGTAVPAGVPVPVSSPGAAPLRLVREQMAAALGRLRELEEQVRAVPALRRRLERLQEEKRQLLERLQRRGECRCGCGCGCATAVDGNGDPGGFGDDGAIVSTNVGYDDGNGSGVGSGITSAITGTGSGNGTSSGISSSVGSGIGSRIGTSISSGTTSSIAGCSIGSAIGTGIAAPITDTAIGSGTTGSITAIPVPVPSAAAVLRGRRSVGVGTEGAGAPGGAGGLPGRVAVLERQLRRALGELREARAQLGWQQLQEGDEEQQQKEEEEEDGGDEGHGRPRRGGSGRPGSSSSDESDYHEAVEGPPPTPQPGRPHPAPALDPPGPCGDAASARDAV